MLFAFGSNGSGQLGLGHKDDVDSPQATNFHQAGSGNIPIAIAAGGNHTLVRTASGLVYATGENEYSRCGVTGLLNSKFVKVGDQVVGFDLCSATWEASTFVDDQDRVYVSGAGRKGEIGLGSSIETADMTLLPNFPPPGTTIIALSASMGHTVAVLSNGEVWGWGNGRKGQLGDSVKKIAWSPRRIDGIPFKAVRAVSGREFTYVAGPPEDGRHIVLGSDKWNVKSQAPETLPPWKDIGAGWSAIYVLLQSGELIAWGRNDHGQLPPPNLPVLARIAVGSEHALALTESGQVLAWGWGEHGNCGLGEKGADVKGRFNQIYVRGKVTGIGAGCATSWIVTQDVQQASTTKKS